MNLAETIHDISLEHCNNGGLILGQCLSAVGRVNGTVPDHPNVIELPMTDVAGAGLATGMALADRRPIFIMRFQDFSMLNGSAIVNYAAKLKQLHGADCPIFIRAIASEGLGPVHSSVLHSIMCHFPGIKVVAPTSPEEYKKIWYDFNNDNCPYYVSEHRDTYKNIKTPEIYNINSQIILIGISACANECLKASEMLRIDGIKSSVIPKTYLKPVEFKNNNWTKPVLIADPSYEYCSIGKEIAYQIMQYGGFAEVLSCKDKTKLLTDKNAYPKAQAIYEKVKEMVKGKDIGLYGMTTP